MPAVLQPNAAIVANLRRKPVGDEDIASAKGHAAGTLYITPDGNVLLLRRSPKEENFAGHWALPGGGVEDGESPEDGARREAMEEMGPDIPQGKRKLIDQKVTPTGMMFHTFAQPVDQMFTPRLNGEHTAYTWAPMNKLPSPMHPAVQGTLNTRLGLASDMSPEDWQGMVGGLLKFLAEEVQEPEHAEDQVSLKRIKFSGPGADAHENRKEHDGKPIGDDAIALALDRESIKDTPQSELMAFDRESVRTMDVDGRMHVSLMNISKACVNPYKGSELPGYKKLGLDPEKIYMMFRDPEELEKAAPTTNGVQILRRHIPINAEDHKPAEVVGALGNDAVFDYPYLKNSATFWSAKDIEGIETGKKREISMGYAYIPDMNPGNWNGTAFDGVMRALRCNHVSLVEAGRAGSDVCVGDSKDAILWASIERSIQSLGVKHDRDSHSRGGEAKGG